ncbi:MAG: HD domain-containing protein [Candidatus Falkowbacteria bacterium]|nr:HD domain-containing protein [Candidatus Falkowbacteria bacterium]
MIYTKRIQKAIKFAAKTHGEYQQQLRKGKVLPYISHPLSAGIILALAKASEDVIIAGILHDTIEDSVEEKKVTPEMLEERFGKNVSQLVLSVTEQDKGLSWEDRKEQALEHIRKFSHDSLLVKSADVISNVSELLDDYERYAEETFLRFNAPKEKIIQNQLKVISTILSSCENNPLAEDLKKLADDLLALK